MKETERIISRKTGYPDELFVEVKRADWEQDIKRAVTERAIFGSFDLGVIDYYRGRKFEDRFIQGVLNKSRSDLQAIAKKPDGKLLIYQMIEEYLADFPRPWSVRQLAKSMSKMPDEEFERILRHHEEKMEKRIGVFETRVPEFEERFRRRFAEGNLPLDGETFERRMSAVMGVTGVDPLQAVIWRASGMYYPEDGVVSVIVLEADEQEMEETYTHEMVHALAGKTIMTKTYLSEVLYDDGTSETYNFDNHYVLRSGLGFIDKGQGWKLGWHDEAVTDSVTRRLLKRRPIGYFAHPGVVYDLLRRRGKEVLPARLFEEAYFEDYNPTLPYGLRSPAWSRLVQGISRAYWPGFLAELDSIVERKGEEVAATHLAWRRFR